MHFLGPSARCWQAELPESIRDLGEEDLLKQCSFPS